MTTCPKNPITQSLRSQIDARNIKSRPHQQVPKILLYSELLSTSSIDLTLMIALSLLVSFRTFPRSSFSRPQQNTHQVSDKPKDSWATCTRSRRLFPNSEPCRLLCFSSHKKSYHPRKQKLLDFHHTASHSAPQRARHLEVVLGQHHQAKGFSSSESTLERMRRYNLVHHEPTLTKFCSDVSNLSQVPTRCTVRLIPPSVFHRNFIRICLSKQVLQLYCVLFDVFAESYKMKPFSTGNSCQFVVVHLENIGANPTVHR
jgi:hypothetical protein